MSQETASVLVAAGAITVFLYAADGHAHLSRGRREAHRGREGDQPQPARHRRHPARALGAGAHAGTQGGRSSGWRHGARSAAETASPGRSKAALL